MKPTGESTIHVSKKDSLELTKDKADLLRKAMRKIYTDNDGQKPLGKTTRNIYEELSEYIGKKLEADKIFIQYTDSNKQSHKLQKPGTIFLKDLFCKKKDDAKIKAHQYNFDLCYLYAFGLTYDETKKSNEQETEQKDKENLEAQKNKPKILLSSSRFYMNEAESLQSYLETQLGFEVKKHWVENNGTSLLDLYKIKDKTKDSTKVFLLIGLNYLQDKKCIQELIEIIKGFPEEFKNRTFIICLKDICEGHISINSYAGKYKISEFWNEELRFIERSYASNMTREDKSKNKVLIKQLNNDIQKLKSLIPNVLTMIEFIYTETTFFQHDHFLNYLMLEDLKKIFSKIFPEEGLGGAESGWQGG